MAGNLCAPVGGGRRFRGAASYAWIGGAAAARPGRRGGEQRPADAPAPEGSGLLTRLSDALDLPKDLVFDLPRITIVGGLQMTIENHHGLVEFSPTRVTVNAGRGRVIIAGEELHIGIVHAEEITVAGQLRSITFQL